MSSRNCGQDVRLARGDKIQLRIRIGINRGGSSEVVLASNPRLRTTQPSARSSNSHRCDRPVHDHNRDKTRAAAASCCQRYKCALATCAMILTDKTCERIRASQHRCCRRARARRHRRASDRNVRVFARIIDEGDCRSAGVARALIVNYD